MKHKPLAKPLEVREIAWAFFQGGFPLAVTVTMERLAPYMPTVALLTIERRIYDILDQRGALHLAGDQGEDENEDEESEEDKTLREKEWRKRDSGDSDKERPN